MRKKRIGIILAVALGAVGLAACGPETDGKEPANPAAQEQMEETETPGETAQASINGFAFAYTKGLLEEQKEDGNFICSPFSAWLPLSALINGCEEPAGAQLQGLLGLQGLTGEERNALAEELIADLTQEERRIWAEENGETFTSPVAIANALFVQEGEILQPSFAEAMEQFYQGKTFAVDFTGQDGIRQINAWAEEATRGKIPELIESLDPETVAAIANAIYVSDSFQTAFLEEDTENRTFYGKKEENSVPFMNHKFTSMQYLEEEAFTSVALPLANGGALWLLLPKEDRTPEEVLAGMNPETLEKMAQAEQRTVELSLPKFELESPALQLKDSLQAMGVPLFDAGNPVLTGVLENSDPLVISDAVQKAVIKVEENGVEAAAATVMGIMKMSLEIETEPVEVVCDRPFAFLLTGWTEKEPNLVLFSGVVNEL